MTPLSMAASGPKKLSRSVSTSISSVLMPVNLLRNLLITCIDETMVNKFVVLPALSSAPQTRNQHATHATHQCNTSSMQQTYPWSTATYPPLHTFIVRFNSDAWMLTSSAEPMAPPASDKYTAQSEIFHKEHSQQMSPAVCIYCWHGSSRCLGGCIISSSIM